MQQQVVVAFVHTLDKERVWPPTPAHVLVRTLMQVHALMVLQLIVRLQKAHQRLWRWWKTVKRQAKPHAKQQSKVLPPAAVLRRTVSLRKVRLRWLRWLKNVMLQTKALVPQQRLRNPRAMLRVPPRGTVIFRQRWLR